MFTSLFLFYFLFETGGTEKEQFYSTLAMCSFPSVKPLTTYTDLTDTKLLKKELNKIGSPPRLPHPKGWL